MVYSHQHTMDYGKSKFMLINSFSASILKLPTSTSIFDHFHKLKKKKSPIDNDSWVDISFK